MNIMNVVLTVSESKRLIAKGVVAHPLVKNAMKTGHVVVCKGTTNAYVVEELLGKAIKRTDYVTGHTLPTKSKGPAGVSAKLPDIVFKNGKVLEGATSTGIVKDLGPGDVFIKGANALNYDRQQAALLIGNSTGGTIGAAIGVLIARSVHMLVPVGLEKSIPGDFHDIGDYVTVFRKIDASGPAFWPIPGEIFTELEAISALTGVDATALGAGGIGGAEGAVRLLLAGTPEQVEMAHKIIKEVQGEPAFIEPQSGRKGH